MLGSNGTDPDLYRGTPTEASFVLDNNPVEAIAFSQAGGMGKAGLEEDEGGPRKGKKAPEKRRYDGGSFDVRGG